jgi:hypothetical protein
MRKIARYAYQAILVGDIRSLSSLLFPHSLENEGDRCLESNAKWGKFVKPNGCCQMIKLDFRMFYNNRVLLNIIFERFILGNCRV